MAIHVLKPGLLTTLQDTGRHGHAALGIGAAGAADDVALRLANAIVGNGRDAATLEFTLVGPRLRFDDDATVALVGDATATLDGEPVAAWRPLHIERGSVLNCGALKRGARGYLAVAGGFDVAPLLGSRSVDVNAGIGPLDGRALREGDALPLRAVGEQREARSLASSKAARSRTGLTVSNWSLDPAPWFDFDNREPIRLLTGTHLEHLEAPSRDALFSAEFRIAADSNRVGWRLQGPLLQLAAPLELVSAGVMPGTLQLPPGGQPIVLGVEGPTTGGYPRIGHVIGIDLPRLAQRRPGDALRFALVDLAQARRLLREREDALTKLEAAIHARLNA